METRARKDISGDFIYGNNLLNSLQIAWIIEEFKESGNFEIRDSQPGIFVKGENLRVGYISDDSLVIFDNPELKQYHEKSLEIYNSAMSKFRTERQKRVRKGLSDIMFA